MAEQSNAPIIIKRKKVVQGGGHHGGAWKVAYADFVTAMMAFFLMMWLLGATTEKQRKGIADYFNPTIPVNKISGGGDGAFGGDSIYTDESLASSGTGAGITRIAETSSASESGLDSDAKSKKESEEELLKNLAKMLTSKAGESLVSNLMQRHIVTRLSDEGLVVEVFDLKGLPLFNQNNQPTTNLRSVLQAVAQVFQLSPNEIALHGHVAAVPLPALENPVWEVSSLRANAARQLLVISGVSSSRVQRVTGFADRKPALTDRLSIRNNRIELILLRSKI